MKIFYVNEIKKLLIIISCLGLLIFSCDDREPEDSDSANYVISVESQPVAGGINGDIVGEDVVGATVATRIEAKLSGENDKPIKNVLISFSAKVDNEDYGGFDLSSGRTGDDGTITVLYIDGGSAGAVDNSTTNKFEGVVVTSKFSNNLEDTTRFNVYASQNQVWPYYISLSSNHNEIILDAGETRATLTIEVKNKIGHLVEDALVTLITDKGALGETGETEITGETGNDGKLSVIFNDQGEQSDLGTATIIAGFEHSGFNNATVYDTIQVTIRTDYTLSLQSYPVAFDENDNWVRVGEDVVGDFARTRIIATLTNSSGNPVDGQKLIFNAESLGEEVGVIILSDSITNSSGLIYAYFDDGGTAYQDITATPDFDGVIVTAYIGVEGGDNQEISFSVYPTTIWPYRLSLTTDTLEIALDGGVTFANITGSLLNQLNNPVSNVTLSFGADRGYIDPVSTTTSSGGVSLEFRDTGSQQEVGTAQIIASFNHLGFDSTVTDTVEVGIVTNYILTLESYPVATDGSGNFVLVGEDVAGESSSTRLVVTVTDQAGNAISGQTIALTAEVLDQTVGSFELSSSVTNNQGKIFAYFDDGGNVYQDATGTPDFDGVVVTAYLGDETGESKSVSFSVYPTTIWPYVLYLSSDVDEILLDNGQTVATITGQLLNQLDNAVNNVTLSFTSDKGFIEPEGTTDSTGNVTLIFEDQGEQSDVGLANIVGSFEHPGFGSTISDSVQVVINTNYQLILQSYPVAYDISSSIVIVGEDLSGESAHTLLVATVLDSSSNPVSGISLTFTSTSSGTDVGSIELLNSSTNSSGQILAVFNDGGNVIQDTPGTPSFEGVTATVFYGEETFQSVQFSTYEAADVWPYNLILTTDTDVIYVDGGVTQATLVARLLNALGNPAMNVQISYETSLGFISTTGITDSTGVDTVYFTDLGDPEDVGVSNVSANFVHPGFSDTTLTSSVQISIEDTSFADCAFIEIPSSYPDRIVVQEGGGIESTQITAEIYDDGGNLVNTPTPVTFKLNPVLSGCYLNEENQTEVTVYTVNGIASVAVNSGTEPGVVRIEVTVDCDEDGNIDLTASKDQVIIASGAPYYIEPEYDPNSTAPTGGGFYQTQCAAIVYDKWYNPVEDSTYVYWTIEPILPDTLINAFVEGVSFTANENLSGDSYSGIAFSAIVYSTDAIGDIGFVTATTYGLDGDTISARINEDEGESLLFFVPGQLTLMASAQYWDYTLTGTTEAEIEITAILIDYYGNVVAGAPIAFAGVGVSEWREVGYEVHYDDGVDGAGAGDGCFTWRDYGEDDTPGTLDPGEGNDDHDAFDTTGTGDWDLAEISETFDDFGFDGIEGTFDEGEDNGEWDGYHNLECPDGAIVKTDQDGFARIQAVFPRELCIWMQTNEDVDPAICTFQSFTASVTGTLLIPTQVTSDPIQIELVRSPTTEDCP